MRILGRICIVVVLTSCSAAVTAQAQKHPRPSAPTAKRPAPATSSATTLVSDPPEKFKFTESARALMFRHDFAELDKMADAARASKARWQGGAWKISTFYDALTQMSGTVGSNDDWQRHIAFFEEWIKARPQSITPRVALAQVYLDYAWEARGSGYANSVTDQGGRLYEKRLDLAAQNLMDASELPAKCPQWYFVMQKVVGAKGADKEQLRAVFEKAIAFEPDYFAYYQAFAWYLSPKWSGESGDVGAFADEVYRRIGGKKGAYLYFEIASNLCGQCGDFSADEFSWPKLKEGYAALEDLYGLSPLKVNRFAWLAVTYKDRAAAASAFRKLGDQWDSNVWPSLANFDSHRAWAGVISSTAAEAAKPEFILTPETLRRLTQLTMDAEKAKYENRWADADHDLHQLIDLAGGVPEGAPYVTQAYLSLADSERQQGHAKQAELYLDQAVTGVARRNGSESVKTAETLERTAEIRRQLHNDEASESDLRRAIRIREKQDGEPDRVLLMDRTSLAQICARTKRVPEANALLQDVIKAYDGGKRPDDQPLTWSLEMLGTNYQNTGRYAEAEAQFLRYLHIGESHLPPTSPGLSTPLERLVALYQIMGRQADADRMQARLKGLDKRRD